MGKNRIALILMSAGLLSGGALLTQSNFNKPVKNNISNVRLLTNTNNSSYGCVVNGNGDLSISNSSGEIVGYISVGQMLKLGSNNGKSTFVTVEETGVTGYISNSNIKDITSGASDQVVRMNRKGTVINVSTDVHLRADATMNSGIVANLTNGTNLTITGKQGNWYRVSVNGIKGYIFEEYIGEGNSSTGGIVTVGNGTIYIAPSNGNRVVVINNKVVQNDNHTAPVQPEHHDTKVVPNDNHNNNITPQENNNKPIHIGGKVENPNPQVTPGDVTIHHSDITPVQPEHHNEVKPNEPGKTTPAQPEHHSEPVQPEHKVVPNDNHNNNVKPNEPSKVTPEHHNEVKPNESNKVTPTQPQSENHPKEMHTGPGEHKHWEVQPQHKTTPVQPEHKVVPNDNHNNNVKPNEPSKVTPEHHNEVKPNEPNKVTPIQPQPENHPKKMHTGPGEHKHWEVQPQHKTTPVQPEHKTTPVEHHDVVKPTKPVEHHVAPVVLPAPVITANNATINVNNSFNDSMIDAHATVNGQPVQTTITGNVNTKVPGTYDLTITATNSQGKSSSKVVKVTVNDVAPSLIAHNYTMTVGGNFNYLKDLGVQATSAEGQNLTKDVKLVNCQYSTTTPGVYTLILSVTDNYGKTTITAVKLTVKAPELIIRPAQPITIKVGQQIQMSRFDGMANEPNCAYQINGQYNINEPGTYHVSLQAKDKYGSIAITPLTIIVVPNTNAPKIVVPNTSAPKICANSITITQGQSFSNSMLNASANENNCNITYSGNVNTNEPGVYKVTVTATNSEGQTGSTEVTVTVKAKQQHKVTPVQPQHKTTPTKPGEHHVAPVVLPAPVITAKNATINVNNSFNDSMIDTHATVSGQPVQTTITGEVNTKVPGVYDLTITATNSQGKSSSKVVKVTVDDVAPALIAHSYTMTVGQSFNIKDLNIMAVSAEGQNLTNDVKVISGSVNTNKPGVYLLTLSVTDYYGETSTTSVEVTVKAPELIIAPVQPLVIYAGQSVPMNKFIGTANQPDCTYQINGQYNINKPGTYHVTLQAKDKYGSVALTPLEIIVKEAPMD